MPTPQLAAAALAAPPSACAAALRPAPLAGYAARSPGALPPAARRQRRRRRGDAAAASAAQQQPRETAQEAAVTRDYMAWAGGAGIQSPKLTQAYFEGGLRGAQALDAIAPDEVVVTVPRAAALVVAPNERCPCPDFVDAAFYKDAPWFAKMGVLLLAQRARGRAAPLWGYVEQLPTSIDTPVRWSAAELAELQYPPAVQEVERQQASWRQLHERFRASAPPGGGAQAVAWDDWVWALENVRSRSFSGPYTGSSAGDKLRTLGLLLGAGGGYAAWAGLPLQQALNGFISVLVFNIIYDLLLSKKLRWYAMCPVVDSVNHSSLVQSDISYVYFKDLFELTTKAAYAAGQQVFISYGEQTNTSLLQYYGFTEAGNPNDTYQLSASLGGQELQLTINAKGSFTADSQAAARAALGGASVSDEALRAALLAAAEAELAGKPTSIADDERLLGTPHLMAPRQRMAAEFRIEKKRVLERAVGKGRKRLAKARSGGGGGFGA